MTMYCLILLLTACCLVASIRELCYDFIARNYSEMTRSDQFHSLQREQILEIVQMTASKIKLT